VLIGSSFNSDEGVLFSPQPRAAVEGRHAPYRGLSARQKPAHAQGKPSLFRSSARGMRVAASTALCLLPPHSIRHWAASRQHVQDNHLIYDVQGNQTAVIACRRSMQACRRACVIGILFESAPQRVAISEIVILINPYGRSRGLLHTVFMRTLFTTTRCGRCQGYVDVYHSASSEIHASGSLRLYM
jgi:hypothetical protein